MKTLELTQGTPEWDAHRQEHDNASDAPVVMGASIYKTRDDLLFELHTGNTPPISDQQQVLFKKGHAAEAAIRPHIEALIGEDLFPVVGVSDEHPRLSASFDGLTMDESTNFEHKLWNEELAAAVRRKELPPANVWQCEQQMLVSGAKRTIFVVSDGTPERMVWMEYCPQPGKAEQLLAGWAQFRKDLAAYQPPVLSLQPVAETTDSLPAVSVRMDGSIAVVSNLALFGDKLKAFVAGIDRNPSTDQAFANCEAAVKTLKKAEEALERAEAAALAQIDPVEAMRRTVADYMELARDARLLIDRLVKKRKEDIRLEIHEAAKAGLRAHIAELNQQLDSAPIGDYPTSFVADLGTAMKGKKTVDSLKSAANQALATAKIAATTFANQIAGNLLLIHQAQRPALFPDLRALAHGKTADDLRNLIAARVAEDDRVQQARIDAERVRIQQEEEAKARAKVAAEQLAQMPAPAPDAPRQAQAPAAVSAAPTVSAPRAAVRGEVKASRPGDDAIIEVLALHYRVHETKVIAWLLDMDLQAASDRATSEFAA